MAGSVGAALQIGTDVELSSSALLNFDLRWNSMTAELDNAHSLPAFGWTPFPWA